MCVYARVKTHKHNRTFFSTSFSRLELPYNILFYMKEKMCTFFLSYWHALCFNKSNWLGIVATTIPQVVPEYPSSPAPFIAGLCEVPSSRKSL
jgi:hypothetical protein